MWTRASRQLSPVFFLESIGRTSQHFSRWELEKCVSLLRDGRSNFRTRDNQCFVVNSFYDVTLSCSEEPLSIETSSCVFLCHRVSGGCFCDLCVHVLDR